MNDKKVAENAVVLVEMSTALDLTMDESTFEIPDENDLKFTITVWSRFAQKRLIQ